MDAIWAARALNRLLSPEGVAGAARCVAVVNHVSDDVVGADKRNIDVLWIDDVLHGNALLGPKPFGVEDVLKALDKGQLPSVAELTVMLLRCLLGTNAAESQRFVAALQRLPAAGQWLRAAVEGNVRVVPLYTRVKRRMVNAVLVERLEVERLRRVVTNGGMRKRPAETVQMYANRIFCGIDAIVSLEHASRAIVIENVLLLSETVTDWPLQWFDESFLRALAPQPKEPPSFAVAALHILGTYVRKAQGAKAMSPAIANIIERRIKQQMHDPAAAVPLLSLLCVLAEDQERWAEPLQDLLSMATSRRVLADRVTDVAVPLAQMLASSAPASQLSPAILSVCSLWSEQAFDGFPETLTIERMMTVSQVFSDATLLRVTQTAFTEWVRVVAVQLQDLLTATAKQPSPRGLCAIAACTGYLSALASLRATPTVEQWRLLKLVRSAFTATAAALHARLLAALQASASATIVEGETLTLACSRLHPLWSVLLPSVRSAQAVLATAAVAPVTTVFAGSSRFLRATDVINDIARLCQAGNPQRISELLALHVKQAPFSLAPDVTILLRDGFPLLREAADVRSAVAAFGPCTASVAEAYTQWSGLPLSNEVKEQTWRNVWVPRFVAVASLLQAAMQRSLSKEVALTTIHCFANLSMVFHHYGFDGFASAASLVQEVLAWLRESGACNPSDLAVELLPPHDMPDDHPLKMPRVLFALDAIERELLWFPTETLRHLISVAVVPYLDSRRASQFVHLAAHALMISLYTRQQLPLAVDMAPFYSGLLVEQYAAGLMPFETFSAAFGAVITGLTDAREDGLVIAAVSMLLALIMAADSSLASMVSRHADFVQPSGLADPTPRKASDTPEELAMLVRLLPLVSQPVALWLRGLVEDMLLAVPSPVRSALLTELFKAVANNSDANTRDDLTRWFLAIRPSLVASPRL